MCCSAKSLFLTDLFKTCKYFLDSFPSRESWPSIHKWWVHNLATVSQNLDFTEIQARGNCYVHWTLAMRCGVIKTCHSELQQTGGSSFIPPPSLKAVKHFPSSLSECHSRRPSMASPCCSRDSQPPSILLHCSPRTGHLWMNHGYHQTCVKAGGTPDRVSRDGNCEM